MWPCNQQQTSKAVELNNIINAYTVCTLLETEHLTEHIIYIYIIDLSLFQPNIYSFKWAKLTSITDCINRLLSCGLHISHTFGWHSNMCDVEGLKVLLTKLTSILFKRHYWLGANIAKTWSMARFKEESTCELYLYKDLHLSGYNVLLLSASP